MKKFFRALALFIAVAQSAYPVQALLSDDVYALRAQQYLNIVTTNGTLELPTKGLEKYLTERINKAKLILENHCDLTDGEMYIPRWLEVVALTSELTFCYYYSMFNSDEEKLSNDTKFLFSYYFPFMVHRNFDFGVRKQIGCYYDSLTDFEKPYAATFEKVSPEEYTQRYDAYCHIESNKHDLQILIESKKFAETILSLLAK